MKMLSKDEGKKDKMVKRDTTTLIEPGDLNHC